MVSEYKYKKKEIIEKKRRRKIMKTKKLLALGLLSAMTVTSLSGTSVFAAENAMDSTGATDVSYKPGSSTGGDGDGNVSSWTVDYPVKIVLDDATVTQQSGREIEFAVVNTSNNQPYIGAATVKATLKDHADKTTDGNSIKMQNSSGTPQTNVTMQLHDGSAVIKTDGTGTVAQLNKTTKTKKIFAYLNNKNGATNTQTYKTTLTWNFHSDAVK